METSSELLDQIKKLEKSVWSLNKSAENISYYMEMEHQINQVWRSFNRSYRTVPDQGEAAGQEKSSGEGSLLGSMTATGLAAAGLGENGKRLYKVTFEYKAELDGFFAPCTVIIDQEKQEVLAYGYILEIYLTEGKHEIEIRRIGEAEYQNRIIVEKDTYITVKTVPLSFRKIEVIIQ